MNLLKTELCFVPFLADFLISQSKGHGEIDYTLLIISITISIVASIARHRMQISTEEMTRKKVIAVYTSGFAMSLLAYLATYKHNDFAITGISSFCMSYFAMEILHTITASIPGMIREVFRQFPRVLMSWLENRVKKED